MQKKYKLRDVFSRGMPTITYVDRDHLRLEKDLAGCVAKGYAIIAVTGPSKCGKTVLRRTVIPDGQSVKVEGGQIKTENDFWETIRYCVDVPISNTVGSITDNSGGSELSASLGLSIARIGTKYVESRNSGKTETSNYNGPQKGALLTRIREIGLILVVDDFHYINRDIRSAIVRPCGRI